MTPHPKYKHHPAVRKNNIVGSRNTRQYFETFPWSWKCHHCGEWGVYRRWGEAIWHAFNHVILLEGLCDDSGVECRDK